MYNFDNFIKDLNVEISNSNPIWDIKGLVDEAGKVYSLGTDTKLIGRVFELVIAPSIKSFCDKTISIISYQKVKIYTLTLL